MTKEFKFPSKSSPGKSYTTLLYTDGTTSCNCRGWTTKRSDKERECVHTKKVEAENPVNSKTKAKVADVVSKLKAINAEELGVLRVRRSAMTESFEPKPQRPAKVWTTGPDAEPMWDVEPMAAGVLEPDELENAWLSLNRVAEEKLDGARYVLHLLDKGNRLFSRRKSVTDGKRIEKSDNVPHLRDMKHSLVGTVLDGEITAGFNSKSNDVTRIMGSNSLRAAEVQEAQGVVVYKVFDILRHKGRDLRNLPYRERYKILQQVVAELGKDFIVLPRRAVLNKKDFFESIMAEGGEGVILKDLDAPYEEGVRSMGWAKVKREKNWNVVCMGFTKGKNAFADTFGAIKFGMYSDDGELKEVGQCSGLSLELRRMVNANREGYLGCVFEVKGQEMTEGGRIRHPRFKEWRLDVDPKTVTLEDESKSI